MNPVSLTRRSFLKRLGAAAATAGTWSLTGGGCSPAARRPNFVFILTDDHAHDMMGCAGHPWLETPALDRLAGDGVRFSNAFVTCSLCSPSRASFLTGLYAHTHGVCANEGCDLPADVPTFPQLLQASGYRTAFVGKWHMARWARPRPGFDHWASFSGQGDYHRNTLNIDGEWQRHDEYVTDMLTDYGVRFLEAQRRQQPFMLILSHKAVHQPFEPARRHAELYSKTAITHPRPRGARLDLTPDWGGRRTDIDLTSFLLAYSRTLAAVDESLARVRATLERNGHLDRTVIIYAGDNGFMMGEHGGLWDKRAAYERSIRIPLIIRYPRFFTPGTVCPELALNTDLAPTLLSLAEADKTPPMHGLNLVDLVSGRQRRDAFLYEYFHELESPVPTTLAVRAREWKYIIYPDNPEYPQELYHLSQDPDELMNRAPEAGYRSVLSEMAAQLSSLQEATGYRPCEPIAR